jgi:hypothetical protein
MARRPNYGFEKRQKEILKQKKKEEKEEKKRLRKEAGLEDDGIAWDFDPSGEEGDEEEGAGGAQDGGKA